MVLAVGAALDVAEQVKSARHGDSGAVRQSFLPARNVVEDHLRDAGVVADDDEDRRCEAVGAGPFAVSSKVSGTFLRRMKKVPDTFLTPFPTFSHLFLTDTFS